MELELKHLVGYLPYGLKCLTSRHQIVYGEKHQLLANGISIGTDGKLNIEFLHDGDLLFSDGMKQIYPILHPLSDLTKEIEVNGETFVPIIELAKLFHNNNNYTVTHYNKARQLTRDYLVNCCVENDSNRYTYFIIHEDILKNPFEVVQKLIKWHFDIYGLIDAGLAIDIKTLDTPS